MTGIAFLELYRNTRDSDPEAAKIHKAKATEYIQKGPPLAGKQKVMAQQLPFDIYIVAKVQKWTERADTWKIDLVDAIGASPYVEMMFFWNGIKKCGPVELQKTIDLLEWSRTSQPEKFSEDLDEKSIVTLLKATVLRNMDKFVESKDILQKDILSHEKFVPSFLAPTVLNDPHTSCA